MLQDVKLGVKIGMGFGLVLLIAAGIGIFATVSMQQIRGVLLQAVLLPAYIAGPRTASGCNWTRKNSPCCANVTRADRLLV